MKSKWPAFLLGLALGVALAVAGARLQSKRPASPPANNHLPQPGAALEPAAVPPGQLEADLATAQRKLADAERQNQRLAVKVQELLKAAPKSPATPSVTSEGDGDATDANPLAAMAKMFDGKGGSNRLGGAMREMMKTAMEQQMEGRMGLMKSRLNLTAEQEAAIREALEKQAGVQQELSEKMLSGKLNRDELANATKGATNPDETIKALLTPEQQAAYADVKKEETANNARLIANAEMLQMQQSLGLTSEQQDRVFSVLVEQAKRQLGDPQQTAGAGGNPTLDLRGQLEQKAEALQKSGVLDADQLARYRRTQESQLKMMEMFLPKAGTKDAPTPAIIPKP